MTCDFLSNNFWYTYMQFFGIKYTNDTFLEQNIDILHPYITAFSTVKSLYYEEEFCEVKFLFMWE